MNLNYKVRDTGHGAARHYEGKPVLGTKRSRGRGDSPAAHMIRQQLQVNERQFRGRMDCTVEAEDYIAISKEKRLILKNKFHSTGFIGVNRDCAE